MQTVNPAKWWLTSVCVAGCGLLAMLPGLALAHAPHVETEAVELAGEHPDQATLEAAFAEAAADYGVPAAILKAVAFVESRWVHAGPTVDYGYGIMHLVNNSDSQTLIDAAKLTGYTVDELVTDPIANVRGGAAVIAKYAEATVGQPQTLEDYWEALKLFSGLNPEVQAKQAYAYYAVLAEGASADNNLGMQIDLPAESVDLSLIGPEDDGLAVQSDDYGPAIWNPADPSNYGTSRFGEAIDRWVNHWVGTGTYAGAISWFKNPASNVSAHFVMRQSDGQLTQMVRIAHRAWHCGNWNSRSIGIEHEATPSYPWPQNAGAPMLIASSTVCRHFCNAYGIPKTRTYIVGHQEVPGSSTACPGNLPWDTYMNLVVSGGVINPPYNFDNDVQGWTVGNCLNGPWHSNSGGWPGILYVDQTCNDAFVYSPPTNFTGGSNQAAKVRIYNPGGAHDMQLFWTSAANPSWSEANSSGVVSYSSATGWTEVFLPLTNARWIGHNITRLRLDFDNTNGNHRWHVDYVVITSSLGTLTGTVTNASGGAALSGATVALSGVGNTTTNSSGVYTFSNVNGGSYTVSASKTSFNGANANVTITPGQTTTQNLALTPSDTQAPSVPTGLTGNATGATTVQLSWNASTDNVGVTGYDIRRDGATVGSSTGTSYTDNSATPDTTHSYQVRAKDAVPNVSDWSEATDVTTPPAPPSPTVVFSDGFNGNLNNWTQQVAGFDYSTAANRGGLTGAGAAFVAAGEADQMHKTFARPFAQGVASGYFWDGKGGWSSGVCGWIYRQSLSLREPGGTAGFILDNCFASNVGNGDYFYRYLCCGWASTYTSLGARDTGTDCNGTWVHFETTITPGAPGANPGGSILLKATDRAGAKSASPALDPDFFNWGIGRITLGLGVTSANEGYWDDISFTATPPGVPTMGSSTALAADQIQWNFSPADNNFFGWDVATGGGTIVAPQYPTGGWLNRNATSWTEGGLTPNTAYSRKVRAWNGTLNSGYSNEATGRTLSPAPSAASATADEDTVCVGDPVTWTAVGGFGAGKVEYYEYAWDQNATHAFTGSEAVWSSGPLELTASATGTWYLHVRGFNADDVANGTYSYAATCVACAPPAITSAVSRKSHGGAGDFDLDVSASTAVEGRSGGPTELIVGFDAEIQGVDGLDTTDVSLSSGSVTQVGIVNGDELHVELSGVAGGTALQVSFPGISDTGGQAVSDTLCFRVLAGDVNGDGQVNVLDLVAVRNELNQAAAAGTFTRDVTADGTINVLDLVAVRNNLNQAAANCP